jgi:hypothetical protein
MKSNLSSLFKRQIAIPSDHGAWVFLLVPLVIGLFAGNGWNINGFMFLFLCLGAFLIRQPISVAVKAYSGRRSRKDLPAAIFWTTIYLIMVLMLFGYLILQGFYFISYLAVPGILVFIWYFYLLGKRAERRQIGLDVVASGVLALSAPGAYWVSVGSYDSFGWYLWLLMWLQSSASIVYAFLRLGQRGLEHELPFSEKIILGKRALIYSGFNLILSFMLGIVSNLSLFIWIPFLLQFLEVIWGVSKPAYKLKPTQIGMRQLFISIVFAFLFILVY